MKNVFFTFFAVILICGCASTGTSGSRTVSGNSNLSESSNSLDYILNGEYAFYLDERGEDPFYRGYLKFSAANNKSIVFVRNININAGYEEVFMFNVEDDEDGYPSKVSKIEGQFNRIEVRQALPDFLNFTSLYLQTRNNYQIQSGVDDEWDDYTLVFSFNKVLPFFGFYDMKIKGEDESLYTLLFGGRIDLKDIYTFYNLKPGAGRQTEEIRQVPQIPAANEKKVEVNGISVTLDDNWRYNGSTNLPGYWLSLRSIRDSQISVERANLRSLNIPEKTCYMFLKLFILLKGSGIEMDTVTVSEIGNGYQMEYYAWEKNMRSYLRAIVEMNDDVVIAINFSSFADIYDANKNYYERILASVSVN